ncbi:MAG: hypothetical protein JO317_06065 [Verrucomicrobiae bacterium]|nr:hypothetical protein [Verrucomicrobiae bacterium]
MTILYVLGAVVVVAIAIFFLKKYSHSSNVSQRKYYKVRLAFENTQASILHGTSFDIEEVHEFVLGMEGKDQLFRNDRDMLQYIEEYYRNVAELQRKNERLKHAQSDTDRSFLKAEKDRLVEWFRSQGPVIKQKLKRYD